MAITRKEIAEWSAVIRKINSFDDAAERDAYLQGEVEDAAQFLQALREVDPRKLKKAAPGRKPEGAAGERDGAAGRRAYKQEEVIEIFQKSGIEEIVSRYTKRELLDMYLAFYTSKPRSSDDKTAIAGNIHQYICTMKRTKALLG